MTVDRRPIDARIVVAKLERQQHVLRRDLRTNRFHREERRGLRRHHHASITELHHVRRWKLR